MDENRFLEYAKAHFKKGLKWLIDANGWDQLGSGYGVETYNETIKFLIKGIEDYQKKEKEIEEIIQKT